MSRASRRRARSARKLRDTDAVLDFLFGVIIKQDNEIKRLTGPVPRVPEPGKPRLRLVK